MSKQFIAILAAIVLVFIGIFAFSGKKSQTGGSSKSSVSASSHLEGSTSTGVTLVEYGDYQCPYCQQYYPTLKAVADKYKDQIQFQFRNFPLVNAHQNAFAAARAAEAASLQGKFWEMHDALYETGNWQVWYPSGDPTPYFKQYAQQIGLDATKFATDFASSPVNDVIRADMAAGTKLEVQGTPAFFLDGKLLTTPANTIEAFDKVIKAEIAKKKPADTATPAATAPATDPSTTPVTTTTSGQ
jgi:protein-disulfide isomerase